MEITPTRTQNTLQQYRKHYARLEKRTVEARIDGRAGPVTPAELADYYLANEGNWKRETARVYRAALTAQLQQTGTSDARAAIARIHRTDEKPEVVEQVRAQLKVARATLPARSSTQKAKRISQQAIDQLIQALSESRRQWARPTRAYFIAGTLTGLRPGEWEHAVLDETGSIPLLIVRNAKHTNGRAHGQTRTLDLSALTAADLSVIRYHCSNVRLYGHEGRFSWFYDCCRMTLQAVADTVFRKDQRHPSLYTGRHVFAANAKLQFSTEEVAAMMGHAATDTAGTHYAPRWSSTGGRIAKPTKQDVRAVQAKSRAKAAALYVKSMAHP